MLVQAWYKIVATCTVGNKFGRASKKQQKAVQYHRKSQILLPLADAEKVRCNIPIFGMISNWR